MAISSRELLLIVRAQNQASQALRRVAGDMRALGKVQNLQARRARVAIQQRNLDRQRARAIADINRLQGGSGALGLERRRLNNEAQRLMLGRAYKNLLAERSVRLNANRVALQALDAAEAENIKKIQRYRHELGTLNARHADLTRQQKDLTSAIRAAKWEKFGTFSRMMGHFGRVMQLAGLVGGAALGYAANAAANFNKQVVLVATQTGKVGSGMGKILQNSKQLEKGLLGVAATGVSSMEEVTDAAYDLFSTFDQLGDSTQGITQGIGIMKLFSKASIAGMTDINTVANGVIASLTAFDEIPKTAAGVQKVLQRMFAAVRFGRMTFAEFAQTLGTAAPAAKAAGQSFDVMAGTIAFLSRPLGVNKAAIGFARLSEIFSRKKFLEGIHKAGISITKTNGALLPMPEIIDRLAKKFPKLTKGGGEITRFFKKMSGTEGTIQARRAFVFLMQGIEEYRRVLGKTIKDNNEFSRSFDAMSKTTGVKWAQFLNHLKVLFIQLGNAAIPTLLEILKPVEDLVNWFAKLDDQTKKQIGKVAVWTAALLLVGGTILTVGGAILGFIAILGKMGIMFKSMSVLIIAASVAVAAFKGHWDSLSEAMTGVADIILGSWTGFIAGSVLAVVAIRKVSAALVALKGIQTASMAAEVGAGGLAGLLAGGRRTRSDIAGVRAIARETGGLKGVMKGAALSAALLPGPLKIAAVAVAGLGVGALLWHRHMEAARKEAEKAAAELARVKQITQGPIVQAKDIGQIGLSTRGFMRASLDLKDMNARLKEMRAQLKGLKGDERAQMQRDIQRALLDRADTIDAVGKAWQNMANKKSAVAGFFQSVFNQQAEVINQRKKARPLYDQIAALEANIARVTAEGGATQLRTVTANRIQIGVLRDQIAGINAAAANMERQGPKAFGAFREGVKKMVKDLQSAELLPKGKKGMLDRIVGFVQGLGHMPTLAQLRGFIEIDLHPKSKKPLPKVVKEWALKQKAAALQVKFDAVISMTRATKGEDIPKQLKKKLGKKMEAIITARAEWSVAKTKLDNVAKKKRTSTITVIGNTQPIMSQISALQRFLNQNPLTVTVNASTPNTAGPTGGKGGKKDDGRGRAIANENAKQAVAALQARRTEFRKAFSEPIKEAIAEGRQLLSDLFDKVDELREIPKSDKKKPLTVSILIQSTRKNVTALVQYYRALDRLRKRGTPEALVQQLAEMGIDASKYLKMLSKATKKHLREFIQQWIRAQAAIKKAANNIKNIMRGLFADASAGAQGLMQMYDDFHSVIEGIVGTFLEGFDFSWGITAAQILDNVNKRLLTTQKLVAGVAALKALGVPFDIIQQFLALGADALPTITAFLAGTPEQQAAIIAGMKANATLMDGLAKELVAEQIKQYKKFGAAIAAGIIAGLIDNRPALLKYFKGIFADLLKIAKAELGIKSPSSEFYKVGQHVMMGFQGGLSSIKPVVGMPTVGSGSYGYGGYGGGGNGMTMIVNAHHTETLDTTLARASFRLRNRR